MQFYRRLLLWITVLTVALLTGAVVSAQDATPEATPAPVSLADFKLAPRIQDKLDKGETLQFYLSYQDVSNEFAPDIRKGMEKAAAELGVKVDFVGPVGNDADGQVNELETLLEKADGLAISSVSTDALAPIIDKALDAGIPVVTFNTDNPASHRLAFAGQDLVESGRVAGKLMGEALNGTGKVIITTVDAAAQWSLDREKGAREGLAAFPGITIVNTINTTTEPQTIYSTIENAMLANPDVSGILSLECCSTPAAGEYVQRNDLIGKVKVVGFDLVPRTVELVEAGAIVDTIDQAPDMQGYYAVKLLAALLKGTPITGIDTGVGIYTPDNIAEKMNATAEPTAEATP